MWLFAVNSDGVRRARSWVSGVSTIATLREPPAFDLPPLSWPPPQPTKAATPIANGSAIKARRTVQLTALLSGATGLLDRPRRSSSFGASGGRAGAILLAKPEDASRPARGAEGLSSRAWRPARAARAPPRAPPPARAAPR